MKEVIITLIKSIREKFKEKLPKVKEAFKAFAKKLKEFFKNPKASVKEFLKDNSKRQRLKIVGIFVLIIALIAVSGPVYRFTKTAYLIPYTRKYNIEFPEGILKDMCDAYGKDQNVCGALTVEDLDYSANVSNIIENDCAFLENGGDVYKDQHFRALRCNFAEADIESLYSTSKGFLKASQKINFTTLFEEEVYKVVAAFYINNNPEDDGGYIFPYNFCGNMSKKDFEMYEDILSHRALYDTGYEYSYDDYFLTISVTSDFMEDFRFVIVCVKTDEKHFEKSEKASDNKKIFYPQVWFDENKQENPYRFTSKWIPKNI
ncbi:MAG: hypothetical protein E7570_08135 [Ruminococcaceae bacterium]|nr:hypothetical protein [Oscillospiraceae bacterium]